MTTSCTCKLCDNGLLLSSNEWAEVSSTYFTYVDATCFSQLGLELVEPRRPGSKNSELEGCYVKPLRCTKCKTGIGLKCLDAPPEKKAYLNRGFFKLSKMTLKSASSVIIEANIGPKKLLAPTTTPNSASSPQRDECHLVSMKNAMGSLNTSSHVATPDPASLRKPQEPQAGSGQHSSGPFDRTVIDLEEIGPSSDLALDLQDQGRDIDRIFEAIDSLQYEISAIKDSIRDIPLRQPESHAGEIEVLTENVSKFSKGMGEVEGLKFEIKMMQQRLKRLEEADSTKRTIFGIGDYTQDFSRATTPTATRNFSPFRTPRNQSSMIIQEVGSRTSSRGFSERPSGGHPLRNVEHVLDGPPSRDGDDAPSENIRPSSHQMLSERVHGDDHEKQNPSAGMPASTISYADPRQNLFDHQPNTRNGHGETLLRAAFSAHAERSSVSNDDPGSVAESRNGLSPIDHGIESHTTQEAEEVEIIRVQPHLPAPQATPKANIRQESPVPSDAMVSNTQKRRQPPTNTLVKPDTSARENPDRQGAKTTDTETKRGRTKRRKTTASGETVRLPVFGEAPSPSLWAVDDQLTRHLNDENRNQHGLLLRRNGTIDRRSIRYMSHDKDKRSHRPAQGPRDAEGYLLRPDGTRDIRSVRIIDSAKKRKARAEQAVPAVPLTLPEA